MEVTEIAGTFPDSLATMVTWSPFACSIDGLSGTPVTGVPPAKLGGLALEV